ncbi:MAG TPA: hypothetical protein VF929_01850, partial [Gemmatimonadaceae bacterium]
MSQLASDASRALTMLTAAGIVVSDLHVQLTGTDASTRDTVIALSVVRDSLRVDIPVQLLGTGQSFTALVELRRSDHTVLFSGTQVVVAWPAGQLPTQVPVVTIHYSGPGQSVASVIVNPPDTTIVGTSTRTYVANALDAASKPVTDLLVQWTTSDPSVATVVSTGGASASVATLGKRGSVTLTATTPLGISASAKLAVVPVPTHLVIISGDAQTGGAGTPLPQPMVVEVQAADNLPVPGVSVSFRAMTTGGGVATTSITADASGRASTIMTLGKTGGSYQYEASVATLAGVSVAETAIAAPPTAIAIVSGDAQSDSTARTLAQPLVVKVTDQVGNPVASVAVNWQLMSGTGSVVTSVSPTDVNGLASTKYVLGLTAGAEVIQASIAGLTSASASVVFRETAIGRGAGSIVIVSGNGQSGTPNLALPAALVARVVDVNGVAIVGATVTWSAPAGRATFSPTTAATDANGQVSTTVTLGALAGAVGIAARTATLSVAAAATIVAGPPASITRIAGDNQSATVGSGVAVGPSVLVKDAVGNVVAGAVVTFAIATGGGSASGVTATTSVAGVATVGSWTMGSAAGANTLTATTGALNTTFTATGTAGFLSTIQVVSGPSALVSAQAADFVVQIVDAQGNAVAQAGVVISYSHAGGSGPMTTNAQGMSTFSIWPPIMRLGTDTIVLSAPGLATKTFTLPIVTGPASTLNPTRFPTPTAQSGVLFNPQPVIRINDAGLNPVAAQGIPVSIVVVSGGGTLHGTTTVTTDATGAATFTDLSLTGPAGQPQGIQFTSPGFSTASPYFLTLTPGPAAHIAISSGDNQSAFVGTSVPVAPAVLVTDAYGNPVPHSTVSFYAYGSGEVSNGSSSGGSIAVMTNAAGIATLAYWKLLYVAGSSTLVATADESVNGVQQVTFHATAMAVAGTKLRIVNPPSSSAVSGVALAAQPSIQIVDASNNAVASSGVTIIVSIGSGAGVLTNATATTNASGLATFSGLSITGAPGSVTLSFASTGLTSVASVTIALGGFQGTVAVNGGNIQSAAVVTAVPTPPSVLVKDAGGNPAPGAVVQFTAQAPGAMVSNGVTSSTSVTVTTNAQGVATLTSWTLGTVSGTQGLSASVVGSSTSPATFTATATFGPAAGLVAVSMPTTGVSSMPFSMPPALQVVDAYGNTVRVANIPVTAHFNYVQSGSMSGGTATTNASGIATFTSLVISAFVGNVSLMFDGPGLAQYISPNIVFSTGAATAIRPNSASGQTATVGTAVSVPPSVRVSDDAYNPVAGIVVTFITNTPGSLIQGTGSPGSMVTVTTDTAGIATLSSWTLSPTAGTNQVVASFSGGPVVFTALGVPASGNLLSLTTPASATITNGVPFASQPVVQLRNASNVAINQSGVAVTAFIV